MKTIFSFTFTVLSISTSILAQDLTISYGAGNELILKSKSCEKLIEQHQAICDWKKKIEPSFAIPAVGKNLCKSSTGGLKSMTISSCLPQFVKTHHHKKLARSGANCWGTAMSFKELSKKPRFLWTEEMVYWMNSPVCRKLDVGETKEPGDIINVYGPEYVFSGPEKDKGHKFWEALYPGRITPSPVSSGYSGYHNFLHSETYLSEDLSFGKDSPSHEDRFDFHFLKEVYGRSRDSECQENQSLEPYSREYQNPPRQIKGSHCDYFSIAYRCENIKSYFIRQNLSRDDLMLLEEVEALQSVQEKIFPLMLSSAKTLSKTEIAQFVKLSDENSENALNELEKANFEKNKEMLLVLKYFTASGIRKSLEQARLIPATEAL